MARRILVAALLAFGAILAPATAGRAIDPLQLMLVPLGSPIPEFALPSLKGSPGGLSSGELKGKVSLVNVFASWCGPCRLEHPLLMDLAGRDLVPVYGLNYKDDPDSARRWLAELGNPFTAIGADRDGRATDEWGLFALPETFVVDRSGHIAYVHVGALDESVIRETILPLILRLKAETP